MSKTNKPKNKTTKKKKKPTFNVLNFGFMKSVKSRWRKPRGTHNKKRMGKRFTGASPNIGYKNPDSIRGTRKTGEKEVLVYNVSELEKVKDSLVRVAGRVGRKKRLDIQKKAKSLGLRIINSIELAVGKKPPTEPATVQKTQR